MLDIKSKIKAIIFDLDGTIINSEEIWKSANMAVIKRRGFDTLSQNQEEALRSFAGKDIRYCATVIKREFNFSESIEEIIKEKILFAHSLMEKGLEFMDGFEEFHRQVVGNQIKSCIATNADDATLIKFKQSMRLDSFFGSNIFNISHVGGKAKPDPALFLYAAKKLEVSVDECVIFEDSITGFEAARAAGIRCIALKNHANIPHLDKVDSAIESYSSAFDAIREIIKTSA